LRGIGLIEVVLASSLAMVVGVLLISLMVNNTGVFYKETSKVGLGLSANDALSSIRSDIKLSLRVLPSYTNDGNTYFSNSSGIVLQLASVNSTGVISDTFDHIVYFRASDKIYYKLFPGEGSNRSSINQILTSFVDTLTFQYFDSNGLEVTPATASLVKVSLKLAQIAGGKSETRVATTEASLRND